MLGVKIFTKVFQLDCGEIKRLQRLNDLSILLLLGLVVLRLNIFKYILLLGLPIVGLIIFIILSIVIELDIIMLPCWLEWVGLL